MAGTLYAYAAQHSPIRRICDIQEEKKRQTKIVSILEILGQKHVKKRERAREREPNKTIA